MTLGTTERLLRRTRRRLFATTMALLTLLVVGVGAATAVVGLRALDGDVDRALRSAVNTRASVIEGAPPGTGDQTTGDPGEATEHPPAEADTFILVLDQNGKVVQNTFGVPLLGLPDLAAVSAAEANGEDIRTVEAGGRNVRLYTVKLTNEGTAAGYLQGGFVLTLHDRQSQTLVLAIAAVGAVGLVAAALITLVVTGRALGPIREGFEAQRRFVADASHELRTPAALIRANAEVLEREGLVTDDGRPLVEDIIGESDRLGGLVGDLLQLAAWDETRLTVTTTPLDVAGLAADTVRGATALAAERDVRLEHVAAGPVFARADRDRLVQLLLILVDNAIDHSPPETTVTVSARRAGSTAVIEVSDEGPGIPQAEMERIFEPFTRLHGTTRHGSGGTGLGLAIARRITNAMDGSIVASSPDGGGARFTVSLPAAEDQGTHPGPTH